MAKLRSDREYTKEGYSIIHGWGVNDANYPISRKKGGWWRCPIYRDWVGMLERGFCLKLKAKNPTYTNVTVCDEWKYFSKFRDWVLNVQPNKNWENCELDKDLLVSGNKIYSPDTCTYVDHQINIFMNSKEKSRGLYLIGCSYHQKRGKFKAACNDPFRLKDGYLGYYVTELEAHKAWQAKKHEYACQLADLQDDPRVADALRQRYATDKDWSKS